MKKSKLIGFISGITVFAAILIFADIESNQQAKATLAVAALMAIWWVSEALPISITGIVPIILFPFLGVMDGKAVSSTYANHIIFLFIGGFLVASAIEKWNLHKRIALRLLSYSGIGQGKVLFVFMFATAFLSMWISNTAAAIMMVPIAMSVVKGFEDMYGKEQIKNYPIALLLGIAYSASIGGIATLVGTPPNMVFVKILGIMFDGAPEISFAQWMMFALPISAFMLLAAWALLYRMYRFEQDKNIIKTDILKQQYKKLGKITYEEKAVGIVFFLMAILLIFRTDIKIGSFEIKGWTSIFANPKFINDGTVAILAAIILFIIPSKKNKQEPLLKREAVLRLPWNILLLFGGGFALAEAFKVSGLSVWFGNQMAFVADMHPLILIFSVSLLISFLTELTSNTATTNIILPILAGMAVKANINPLLLMLPATLAASLAFMLPVATPPNAVVFSTGHLKIKTMAKTGFLLNITGVIIITLITYFMAPHFFDIPSDTLPQWAHSLSGGN